MTEGPRRPTASSSDRTIDSRPRIDAGAPALASSSAWRSWATGRPRGCWPGCRRSWRARCSACWPRRSYLFWPTKRAWSNLQLRSRARAPARRTRASAGWRCAPISGYGRYLVELMRLPSRPLSEVADLVPDLDAERDRSAIWQKRPGGGGLIFAVGHIGNNEAVAAAISRHGLPISVVADDSSFPEVFELLRRQREGWGVHVVAWRNLRAIFGVLRRREMLALLVDWGYRSDGIPVRLFDAWTTLPAGPATLAARTGSRILPITIHRRPDNRFHVALGRAHRHPLRRPGRTPARDAAPGRRARRGGLGRTGPVVQLQAHLAGDRCRGGRPGAPRADLMQAGRQDPGPDRAWAPADADVASVRGGEGRDGVVTALGRSLRTRVLLAASWLACHLPEGPLTPRRRDSPAMAGTGSRPSARPRPGAICGGSASSWRRRDAGARRCGPPPTDPRALERLVRSAFRHNARYYLEVARTPSLRSGDVDRRLDIETP